MCMSVLVKEAKGEDSAARVCVGSVGRYIYGLYGGVNVSIFHLCLISYIS